MDELRRRDALIDSELDQEALDYVEKSNRGFEKMRVENC